MRVETLYRFNFGGSGLSFLLGPLTAWRVGEASSSDQVWLWCAALYVISGLRLALGWLFYRRRELTSDRHWHWLVVASAVLVGCCWGSLVLPVFNLSPDARLLVTALLMAVAGIGMVSYMVSALAFLGFALPVLACLIYATLTNTTVLGFDAGLMVSFFSIIMIFGSRQVSTQFESMSRARWLEAKMRIEADQANEAKSRFLAAMSHEVRTPINGITGMAQMLRDAQLQPPFDRYLQAMQKACGHLVGVVNDILDFARISARKLQIEPIVFDLREMVSETLAPQELVASNKGLSFNIEIEPGLPQWIRGDRLRIAQVLINLVSNAVKFTPSGSISVQLSAARGDRLRIVVRDSGIGIEAAKLKLIFEPFAQAEASSSRRYGGSGLGLSICHELIALMDGEIEISSEVGQGSEFTVHLPLIAAEAPATQPALSRKLAVECTASATESTRSRRPSPSPSTARRR